VLPLLLPVLLRRPESGLRLERAGVKISYPAWRKRPDRGEIAGCDACAFWRRHIVLCAAHQH